MLRSGLILRPAADAHSGPLSPLEVNADMKRFEPWWNFRASAMQPKPINPCSIRIYGLLFWGQESGGVCISGRPRRPMNQARRVAQQPAATGCVAAVIQPASSAGGSGPQGCAATGCHRLRSSLHPAGLIGRRIRPERSTWSRFPVPRDTSINRKFARRVTRIYL